MIMTSATNTKPRFAAVLVGGLNTSNAWNDLEEKLQELGSKVHVFRFMYGAMGSFWSGLNVSDVVDRLSTFVDEAAGEADEIILVGHSMGGLLIKRLLTNRPALTQRIRLVVLAATPRQSAPGQLGRFFTWSKFKHLRSPKVEPREWEELVRKDNLDVVSLVGLRDSVVSYESARGDRSSTYVLPEDHASIARTTDFLAKILQERIPEIGPVAP